MTPNARTMEYLRKRGWTCAVTETWIPKCQSRRDLFGCVDVVGLREVTLGVQATTVSNVAARRTKAAALPALLAWLRAGNLFEVWGWKKPEKKEGIKRRTFWEVAKYRAELRDGHVEFSRLENEIE